MARQLVLSIRLHDRFHGMAFGAPEWPPSPARVFQALVAGVAMGKAIPDEVVRALDWLEGLAPPRIGAPRSRVGAEGALWVPNNDLDAKDGDPARIGELRVLKRVVPRLLEGDEPLLYVWSWEGSGEHAEVLVGATEQIYQLGRGVDLAWAHAEIHDEEAVENLLARYAGVVHEPVGPGDRSGILCPVPGSLTSLRRRFEAQRIRGVIEKKKRSEVFENAPKPLFRPIHYGRRTEIVVYDLVHEDEIGRPYSVALDRVVGLVTAVRDAAAGRLRDAFPEHGAEIERILVGRKSDGRDGGPIEDRIRIVPLPSIGHEHADFGVRRLAVELPGGALVSAEDLVWAFDGLAPPNPATGEVTYALARADDVSMLDRYRRSARSFRSVTPVALPDDAARRRIEPSRRAEEAKGGRERADEQRRAQTTVRTALRHAGIRAVAEAIEVQREPFDRRATRAEPFAEGARFAKERLWHVRIAFDRPVDGPLVIGDGRFLGLGVLAPVEAASAGILAFAIVDGLADGAAHHDVARALRRAVMARVQRVLGPRDLAAYFSAHGESGRAARDAEDPHLSFVYDPAARRLLVVAPHVLERREPAWWERRHVATLERALEGFDQLRAGRAGLLVLRSVRLDRKLDPLVGVARTWRSITPYRVNRHAKKVGAEEALVADVRLECRRRGLPEPRVIARSARGIPGIGLVGDVELEFASPVNGPIVIGRDRHLGGGVFAKCELSRAAPGGLMTQDGPGTGKG